MKAARFRGKDSGRANPMKTRARYSSSVQRRDFSIVTTVLFRGLPDKPEHYHTVTIDLAGNGTGTEVILVQDHNATEAARAHSEKNWKLMLGGLKKFVEK
jgi:hypothetical protein